MPSLKWYSVLLHLYNNELDVPNECHLSLVSSLSLSCVKSFINVGQTQKATACSDSSEGHHHHPSDSVGAAGAVTLRLRHIPNVRAAAPCLIDTDVCVFLLNAA